jgi:hypothetical protein
LFAAEHHPISLMPSFLSANSLRLDSSGVEDVDRLAINELFEVLATLTRVMFVAAFFFFSYKAPS